MTTPSPKALPTAPRASRPTGALSLDRVTTAGRQLPSRILLHAPEKWGKTSFAAQAPRPIVLMTRGEDGLRSLIDAGQLPETAHLDGCAEAWADVLAVLHELIVKEHAYQTLVIDTLNGAERLCHEHICERQFGGDWSERGFNSYQVGYRAAVAEWLKLLQALDRLREARNMGLLLLCHSKISSFRNPEGPDYDRYVPDLNKETWGVTHKWCDMVLFGQFETYLDSKDHTRKSKARGGQQRVLLTERHAAYDAGNRQGLPAEIELGDSPSQAWEAFRAALKARKPH
jgi:hypothetical protein